MDDNETRIVEQFIEWLTQTYYVYYAPEDGHDGQPEVRDEALMAAYRSYREMQERGVDEAVQP